MKKNQIYRNQALQTTQHAQAFVDLTQKVFWRVTHLPMSFQVEDSLLVLQYFQQHLTSYHPNLRNKKSHPLWQSLEQTTLFSFCSTWPTPFSHAGFQAYLSFQAMPVSISYTPSPTSQPTTTQPFT